MKNLIYSIATVLFFVLTVAVIIGMFTDGPLDLPPSFGKVFLSFVMVSILIMFIQLTIVDLKKSEK